MIIDFYLDFISPFGYLANHRLKEILAGFPHVQVRHHAIDLPRVKLAAGNNGPTNRQIPPKIRYLTEDLGRWAKLYGMPMVESLAGPDTSTLNKGLYLAIDQGQAQRYVDAAWNAMWGAGIDPATAESRAFVSQAMGWEADTLADFSASGQAQDIYERENVAAIEKGIFGVPIFMIGDEMWWGNDRLDFVERYLQAQTAR